MHFRSARAQVKSDVILELGISEDRVLVFDASSNEEKGETAEVQGDLPQEFALLCLLLFLFLLGGS